MSSTNANLVMRCVQLSHSQYNFTAILVFFFPTLRSKCLSVILAQQGQKTFLFSLCYFFLASLDRTLFSTPNTMLIAQMRAILKFCIFCMLIFFKRQSFLHVHTIINFCPGFHPLRLWLLQHLITNASLPFFLRSFFDHITSFYKSLP